MNVFEMINVDKIINNVVDENTKKKNYDELVESIIYTLDKEELKMKKEFILGFPEYANKMRVTPHKYKSTEIFGGKFTGWSLENDFYISVSGEIYEKKVKFDEEGYPDRIYYKKSVLDKLLARQNSTNRYVEGHILHILDDVIDLDWTQHEISAKIKKIAVGRMQKYAERVIKKALDGVN